MGLISIELLVIVVAAAMLLFVGTVWLWPRLAGRGTAPVLGRIGTLLLTQVLVFAAFGLFANRYFGFYGSWGDLLGDTTEPVSVVGHDTPLRPGMRVVGSWPMNAAGSSNPAVAGRIQQISLRGPASRIASTGYVYLPPEYFRPGYARHTFPTALVLTGYPGVTLNLITSLHYPQTEQDLTARGLMPPTVLVMMRPTVTPPRDTECMDVPGGPRTETFFTRDVPQLVSHHYRVGHRARDWGVIGDSTGGYCALKMSMRHPGSFSAAVGLSPSYTSPDDVTTGDLYGGSERLRRENDLMWRLDHEPAPPVSLLVTSSRLGEHDYAATVRFVQRIRQLDRHGARTRVYSIVLDSGGHNFNTWRREIPACLQWLGGRLGGPGGVPATGPRHAG